MCVCISDVLFILAWSWNLHKKTTNGRNEYTVPWDTLSLKQISLLKKLAPRKPVQALPNKSIGVTEDFDKSTRNLYTVIIITTTTGIPLRSTIWIPLRKTK